MAGYSTFVSQPRCERLTGFALQSAKWKGFQGRRTTAGRSRVGFGWVCVCVCFLSILHPPAGYVSKAGLERFRHVAVR